MLKKAAMKEARRIAREWQQPAAVLKGYRPGQYSAFPLTLLSVADQQWIIRVIEPAKDMQ